MPLHEEHIQDYAFRKMGPDEMALWHKRRQHPMRFIGKFVLAGLVFAVLFSFGMVLFKQGLSKGVKELVLVTLFSSACMSIFSSGIALITAVIFYSSGVSKYKQAWEAGVRPIGWEEDDEE